MKVFLINDNESSTNIGCRATSNAIRYLINKKGHKVVDEVHIDRLHTLKQNISTLENKEKYQVIINKLIGGNEEVSLREIRCLRDLYTFPKNLYSLTPKTVNEMEVLSLIFRRNGIMSDIYESIQSSDLVLINAEGAFYGSSDHAHWMLFFANEAVEMDSHCVLTNASVSRDEKYVSRGMREMITETFPKIDSIIFREKQSYEEYDSWAPIDNYKLSSDVAFVDYEQRETLEEQEAIQHVDFWRNNRPDIGPQDDFICVGGNSIYPEKDTPPAPVNDYIELVDKLHAHYPVILLPSKDDDESYLRHVANSTGATMLSTKNSVRSIKNVLKYASAYLGGRYHPAVFALSMGTPVVGMETKQNKMLGLLQHANEKPKIYKSYDFGHQVNSIFEYISGIIEEDINVEKRDIDRLTELAHKNIPDSLPR